jgi:hypothetical protein
MTILPYQLMVDDTEQHIIDLERQLTDLQKISTLTDSKRDYGDFIETSILLKKEISQLRKGLNRENSAEEIYEEEEEEIEHIIKDEKTGKYRTIKPEDLSLEKNKCIYNAFKEIYKMEKYQSMKTYEEEEEETEGLAKDGKKSERKNPCKDYKIYTKICEMVRLNKFLEMIRKQHEEEEEEIESLEEIDQEDLLKLIKKREKEEECRSTI